MADAFDQQALIERVDGDIEFLGETVVMLDEDSPALLDEIHAAAGAGDAAALVRPAHALNGMLANFCAEPAEAAARELETMGREERLNGVESAVDRVRSETERLRKALHEFLRMKTK